MLAEPAPDGIAPTVWSELTRRLADALEARTTADVEDTRGVNDLELTANPDVSLTLEFTHRLPGDYDQNGEPNAADLVPVARWFGFTSESPEWLQASIADGDGNGEINAADVVPIALFFRRSVASYVIEAKNPGDEGSQWSPVDAVPFSAANSESMNGLREYAHQLASFEPGWTYRVSAAETGGEAQPFLPGTSRLAPESAQGHWWTEQGNERRDGNTPWTGAETDNLLWTFDGGGACSVAPILDADGYAYLCAGNALIRVDPWGQEAWRCDVGSPILSTPSVGITGTVYCAIAGSLIAVTRDGEELWRYAYGGQEPTATGIDHDHNVLVGSESGVLHAVTPTGELAWTYGASAPLYTAPAIGELGVYLNCNYESELAVPGSSKPPVVDPDETFTGFGPVLALEGFIGGYVNVFGEYWEPDAVEFSCINSDYYPEINIDWLESERFGSNLEWSGSQFYFKISDSDAKFSLGPDSSILASGDHTIIERVNRKEILWSIGGYGHYSFAPAVDSTDHVYIAIANTYYHQKDLRAFSVSDGSELWRYAPTASPAGTPAVGPDRRLYMSQDDGGLVCIGSPDGTPTVPATPLDLQASKIHLDRVELSWNPAPLAEGYEIHRDDQEQPYAAVGATTTFEDFDAPPNSKHTYWVRAVNSVGKSPLSSSAEGFTRIGAIEHIEASQGTFEHHIEISWDPIEYAKSYQIEAKHNDGTKRTLSAQAPQTAVEDWGVLAEEVIEYRVRAFSATGYGTYSETTTGWLGATQSSAPAADWRKPKHDSGNTRLSSSVGPASTSSYQTLPYDGYGLLPAGDGGLYFFQNGLNRINADQQLDWRVSQSSPSLSMIYGGTQDGGLISRTSYSGGGVLKLTNMRRLAWVASVPEIRDAILCADDVLAANTVDGLTLVDAFGQVSGPFVAPSSYKELLAELADGSLLALPIGGSGQSMVQAIGRDGSLLWEYDAGVGLTRPDAVVLPDSTVLLADKILMRLDSSGGEILRLEPDDREYKLTGADPDGGFYAAFKEGVSPGIARFDSSGQELWHVVFPVKNAVTSLVIDADANTYFFILPDSIEDPGWSGGPGDPPPPPSPPAERAVRSLDANGGERWRIGLEGLLTQSGLSMGDDGTLFYALEDEIVAIRAD